MGAQKTQNTAAFEVPQYAVFGRRYECSWKSMLKRQCLVNFKGTTSKFGERVEFPISQVKWKKLQQAPIINWHLIVSIKPFGIEMVLFSIA